MTKNFIPNTQVTVPQGTFQLKEDIDWEDSLVFEPVEKDFVLTPVMKDKIGKLAMQGASNEEICLICNINTKAFKNYLKKNELFADWLKRLRTRITFLAKSNILFALEKGSVEVSKWVLDKEEKLNRTDQNCAISTELETLSEDDDAILEAYVTKTITLKKTQKVSFTPIEDPKP